MNDDVFERRISDWLDASAPVNMRESVIGDALRRTADRRQSVAGRRPSRAGRSLLLGTAMAAVVVVAIVIQNGGDGRDPAVVGQAPSASAPIPSAGSSSAPSHPLGLAIVNLDGSVRQELGLPLDAWMPDLSADGTSVLFLTHSPVVGLCGGCGEWARPALVPVGATYGTFIYAGYERGVALGVVDQPVLSPDGPMIAFQGLDTATGNRDIYVSRMLEDQDGFTSAVTFRLTTDPAVDEFPAWSPDGRTIYYSNAGSEPQDSNGFSPTQEIWSVPAFGGAPVRLTDNDAPETQPDVSSDGRVAYWRDGEIWSMNGDGSDQGQIPGVPGDAGLFDPRWSPDGTKLALLRYDPSAHANFDATMGRAPNLALLQVVTVDLGNGRLSELGTRVASDVNPVSWTPDGTALLVNRYDAVD